MIEDIGRCVMQRVDFLSPRTYRRSGPAVHAPETAGEDEQLTYQGLYSASARMEIQPGDTVAVWDLPADEDRPFAQLIEDLPPVPSRILVHTADKRLLELHPDYISITESPEEWDDPGIVDI